MEESHSSRYSIHSGATKMYRYLKQHYWWCCMKRDIVDFVSQSLNCQQVKYEHQKLGDCGTQFTSHFWWSMLKELGTRRDLNLRQWRLLELLKDYDMNALYHPESGKVLAYMEARSSLLEQIWGQQFDDGDLCKIRDKALKEEAKAEILDSEGVLTIKSHICVPRTGDLTRLIMEEAHSLRYFIHPGATKMYRDLKQHYWWCLMKRDIVDFVSWCLNRQQVKYEHKKPGVQTTYNSEKLAKIYIREIVRLHGVPISIISDRGT
ncbi:uncharacterized protein [Solanum lycopersicum]|uniref:uncharacterized protein n=1 Tax=Solanum lycopersicum TaxID=4081 RepID=UPI0037486208